MAHDHDDKIRAAAEKAGREVISAWFHDEKFRHAFVPDPKYFFSESHKILADFMRARGPEWGDGSMYLLELSKHPELKKLGGYKAIEALIRGTPTAIDPWKSIDIIRVAHCTRELRRMTQGALLDPIAGGDLAELQKRLSEALNASRIDDEKNSFSVRDAIKAVVDGMTAVQEQIIIASGYRYMDRATGQFRREMSYLIGAESSFGKSSLTVLWTKIALDSNRRPLIVSAEDPLRLYGDRMVGLISTRSGSVKGINALALRDGKSSTEDKEKIYKIQAEYHKYVEPFFIRANGRPVEQVAGEIASYIAAEKIDIVFCDYLQAFTTMENFGANIRAKLNHVARTLYDVIRNGNAAGVYFSQLTKMPGQKTPTRDWIRDSKDLVNMSDIVLIGEYDREARPQRRTLKVEKVKNGPTGLSIDLKFDEYSACFEIDDASKAEAMGVELGDHLTGDTHAARFDEWDRYRDE